MKLGKLQSGALLFFSINYDVHELVLLANDKFSKKNKAFQV